jgi:two-component system, cell cycle response regulator
VSTTAAEPTADFPRMMELADRALYAAKAAGRDRVWVADGLSLSSR